jgi:formimidoylglutamate deiminase
VLDDRTTLDRYIFSVGRAAVRDVMVGGCWVVRDRYHEAEEKAQRAYQRVLDML